MCTKRNKQDEPGSLLNVHGCYWMLEVVPVLLHEGDVEMLLMGSKVSVCSSAALWFRKAVNASGLDNWPWVSQFCSQSQELIEFLDYKYWISRPPQNSSWDSFSTSGQHFCVFQVLFVLREAWGTKSVPWGIHCGSCWSSSCQLLTKASHFCVLQFEQLRPILSLKLDQGFIYLGKC